MSCGCGKKRGPSRAERIKKQTAKTIKARKRKLQVTRVKSATISPLVSNSTICLSCIESKQSLNEKKNLIKLL